MEYLRDTASLMYEDIPRDCFNAKVPITITPYEDNAVIPREFSVETQTGGFTKWIRASKFKPFIETCKTYGLTTGVPVSPNSLHVMVMAYMPLRDAYQLHALIQNSDALSDSFMYAIQKLEAAVQDPVEPQTLPEEVDMGTGDEKVGYLSIDAEINISVGFTVVNYSVLWSKADKYCMMTFLADPMNNFINNIETCSEVFATRPSANLENLEAALDEARRILILAMYHEDSDDAHGVLLEMFPEIHNTVYLECLHCNPPPDAPPDGVIPYSADTIERLNQSLNDLGYEHYYPPPSIESAQYNLMIAKGRLEYGQLYEQASLALKNARQGFKEALNPILHDLTFATEKLTLMGAVSTDDNPGEDDFLELN